MVKSVKSQLKRADRIEVEWIDAFVINMPTWINADAQKWDKVKEEAVHLTIGIFVHETEDFVAVCQSRKKSNPHIVGQLLLIPKKTIIRIEKI